MTTYRDLRTWNEAQELVVEIYRVTTIFSKDERFGLTSKLHRVSVSVPTNIAEGMGRGGAKELNRYLIMARGSIHEVLSLLHSEKLLGFIEENDFDGLSNRYNGLNAGITSHIHSLSRHY